MRTARSRLGKGFSLERRLSQCESSLERNHYDLAGKWASWVPQGQRNSSESQGKRFREVRLDLGCGKGSYTVECAKRNPDVLFVGVDIESVCVLRSAELAIQEGATNAVFVLDEQPDLRKMFAPGELSRIYLMFPTPFPQKKRAHYRTTHFERLLGYRDLLAQDGFIHLQTDSMPMFEFSKVQFGLAEFDILWETDDYLADHPDEPAGEYQLKTVAKGAKIHALRAKPNGKPTPMVESITQTAFESLVDYLPEDLDELEYVPHGMEGCVTNMRNRKANAKAREALRQRKNNSL